MNVEITGEKKNPLLNRKEVEFVVRYSGPTPPRDEVRDKLIAVLSSDKKLTILDSYNTEFGTNTLKGMVKVYNDEKSLRAEPKHMLARNFEEREKKPKVEPAAKPAAEEGEKAKSPKGAEGDVKEEASESPEEAAPSEESKEEAEPAAEPAKSPEEPEEEAK